MQQRKQSLCHKAQLFLITCFQHTFAKQHIHFGEFKVYIYIFCLSWFYEVTENGLSWYLLNSEMLRFCWWIIVVFFFFLCFFYNKSYNPTHPTRICDNKNTIKLPRLGKFRFFLFFFQFWNIQWADLLIYIYKYIQIYILTKYSIML